MRKRFLILVFSCLIFQHSNLFSQQVSFNTVVYKPEKDNFGFLGVTQDRLGNIWLSSYEGGIYKYDGSGFINFQHNDTNSNSVASDHTECIYADSSDYIWIGTFGQGLDRYNPLTNQFTHFRYNPRENSSLANDTVTAILKDREGNFWIGTYGGLDLFDSKSGVFKHYTHNPNNQSGLSSNSVRSLYEDRQGTLWVGCGRIFANDGAVPGEGGLNRFNKKDGSITKYKHEPGNPNSLETNKVKALFEDSKGNFWVGTTGNGLHLMDRTKGTFTHYYYDSTHPEKLSRPPVNGRYDHITFINEDILGGIWIGSYFGGINRYDPVSKSVSHFGMGARGINALAALRVDTASGFSDLSTWQALFSQDGQIWITILRPATGILFYHAAIIRKGIPFYSNDKMGGVNTFYDGSDSLLWLGSDSGLIKKNELVHRNKIFISEPGNPNSLSNKSINVIRVDREKNLWIGTNGGLNKYDPVSNQFTRFLYNRNIESSLNNDTILSMCLDHNEGLWVGTYDGLDKLDKKSGGFIHFKLEKRHVIDRGNWVNCLREDQNGQLWVGTGGGLYRVNISTGAVTTVLPFAIATSICVDSKNTVWIGADTGRLNGKQNLYRLIQNRFVLFADQNTKEKITDVFDIMEDDHRNLWVSTADVILKINDNRNVVRKFGSGYGVHRNGFFNGDNFKAASGKLYFGDPYGYYSFSPDDLRGNSQPLLNISSFKLNGKETIPDEKGILKEAVWRTDEIRLAHNENNFSFEFSAIDYQGAGEVKILFMLENYDNEWLTYGNGRRAIYFSVPPGVYTLRVKAFEPDGSLSEKSMRIIIASPWWKTWWALTLFGLSAIALVWGFIVYRSRKLLAENKLLEEKVERRTEQLNISLEELKSTQAQLIQSEKMASLGELTAGIAHEIQNPLNFVNNFSEVNKELIGEMKMELDRGNLAEAKSIAEDIETNEDKIILHGRRADSIVKGMLQHSRSSNGTKQLTDINALADEYFRLSYHGLRARDKSFSADLQTAYEKGIERINIIPQDIGRVLLNLFNNAFYAVAEKRMQHADHYEPTVRVSTEMLNGKVEIKVIDNGNGIPKKVLDKIFQPFFTTKPTGQGTGLGLSLSYDIVRAHGGELKVETREGEWTEFLVQIPVA